MMDEEARRCLQMISDSARQMGKLIDDLLAFSRTGRAELRKGRLDMRALLKETIAELSREVEGREVEWRVESLPHLEADRALLKQVWTNLLSNALKYTRPRRPAVIEIGSHMGNKDDIIFWVRDNGVGFDRRYANKLFGVFQRLHRAADFEGTGVGLANVRRIIHRHNGRTWADGEVDKGATFYFSLPTTGESESSGEDTTELPSTPRPEAGSG
jgi:light-regulated signal transduction histidine kinase (bacteriophytochrome)